MKLHALCVGAWQENTWFLLDETTRRLVLVDPGDEPQRILTEVERLGAAVHEVWITHAHIDHIAGVAAVQGAWPGVPVRSHPLDAPLWEYAPRVAAGYGMPFEPPAPPSHELAEGERLEFAGVSWEVWHLPGHAPGHVAFLGGGHCLSGDVLFAGSVGRTDLPLCNGADLARSLERLATLAPATIVHPGHGRDTTVGAELRTNPFLNGGARPLSR
jgi:glyoxylase-like metal-dependent hydrolase (beta-lactamase superfamily II)